MKINEQAFSFECADEPLVGVACIPDEARSTGVIIIVGGPQYRVGSHRQFILLSRNLASAGYPVMRFDYRGMGDSCGGSRSFESVDNDIAAAIDTFVAQCPDVTKVVLWGLCDAASASLLYWDTWRDERVAGLCLLNPWVRSDASLAKTHMKYYYGQRLLQWGFWKKLLTGKTEFTAALRELVSNWRMARAASGTKGSVMEAEVFQNRMARALRDFKGRVMLVLSGNDYTAKEFLEYAATNPSWSDVFNNPFLARMTVPDADHTFSSAAWRADVAKGTLDWLMEVDLADSQMLAGATASGSDRR